MEEINLIVAALTAGATAGVSDTVAGAVKDAYAALRTTVAKALSRRGGGQARADDEVEQLLRHHVEEPEVVRERLAELLRRAGADQDATVVAAAKRLLDELRTSGPRTTINARTINGLMSGAVGSVQINHFPERRS